MNDDVLKFRKICLALIADKKLRVKAICFETGMARGTLTRYLYSKLEELPQLRASILGAMQNFNKHHALDMNYAGIESVPLETTTGKQEYEDSIKLKLKPGVKERREQELKERRAELIEKPFPERLDSFLGLSHGKAKDFNDNKEMRSKTKLKAHFWNFIQEATNCVPENVIITITINGK